MCNQLLFRLLLPEQAERLKKDRPIPSLPLGDIVRGLQAGLDWLAGQMGLRE